MSECVRSIVAGPVCVSSIIAGPVCVSSVPLVFHVTLGSGPYIHITSRRKNSEKYFSSVLDLALIVLEGISINSVT